MNTQLASKGIALAIALTLNSLIVVGMARVLRQRIAAAVIRRCIGSSGDAIRAVGHA